MAKNFVLKPFTKKELRELSKNKAKGVTLSFYFGIKPEINFKSEVNSLVAGKIKEIKQSKEYSKSDKRKMIGMIESVKKEIDLLKLPDEARAIIVFIGAGLERRIYRFPAYIPSELVIESDPYIHPALVALESFPRYLSVIVERDKAMFFKIFAGEIEDKPEVLSSDVPKRIRTSTSDDWMGRREARIERHIEDHLSWHLKRVSAKLTDLLAKNGFDYFLIGIHKELEARFAEILDQRVRHKAIGFWPPAMHYDIKEIKAKSLEVINLHERKIEEALVKDIVNGASEKNWKAILGLDSVLEYLYLHNISLLVVARGYRHPGYLCPNCHYISTHQKTCPKCGSKMVRVGDLIDELLEEAIKRKIKFKHLFRSHKDFDRFGVGAILKTTTA